MGRLTIQKLYCLIEIVHSDLFTQHGKEKINHRILKESLNCLIICYLPIFVRASYSLLQIAVEVVAKDPQPSLQVQMYIYL